MIHRGHVVMTQGHVMTHRGHVMTQVWFMYWLWKCVLSVINIDHTHTLLMTGE